VKKEVRPYVSTVNGVERRWRSGRGQKRVKKPIHFLLIAFADSVLLLKKLYCIILTQRGVYLKKR